MGVAMRILIGVLLLAGGIQARPGLPAVTLSQAGVPEIAAEDFKRLHDAIRPQPGESPWRDIDWMTSIRGARERAAAEGKAILIFTAADGSPLART
jgi:hypothetical protein